MRHNKYIPELVILLLALALRVLLVSHVEWQPFSDSRDYQVLAKNLTDGEGYIQIYQGESPEYQGLTFRAYRMPGYPLLLAALFKTVGYRPISGLALNVIFDLLTILTIFSVAPVIGRAATLLAALIYAFHILWVPILMTEPVITLCATLLAAELLTNAWQKSIPRLVTCGIILAFSVMTKPVMLFFVPFFLFKLLSISTGGRWPKALLFLSPLVLAISFWTYRNYQIFHAPVLFSTNFGAHNASDFGLDKSSMVRKLRSEGLGEVEISKSLTNQIVEIALSNPASTAKIYALRIRNMFSIEPVSEISAVILPKLLTHAPLTSTFYITSMRQYIPVYLLGVIGFLFMIFSRPHMRILPLMFMAFVLLHCVVSNGNIRFMAPMYPLLCVACACLLTTVFDKLSLRSTP